MANPLRELNEKYGQSVWYDNLNRDLLDSGRLQRLVDGDGVSGGTSNPSIFEKAVGAGNVYDDHLRQLVAQGEGPAAVYDALTVTDVQRSADVFRPIYDRTHAADGYASLEVSPLIAGDTQASSDEARRLFRALNRPNAMIKIPGTPAGLPAVEQCLADGLNINITLLFGVENYEQVARAYISALEKRRAAGLPIDRTASVASFFVSRVDTMVDDMLLQKIQAAGSDAERLRLRSLLGKAGIANARIAYQKYKDIFSGPRWQALAQAGARVQRCLWASTSTKNPDYRDVMYVEGLIGPDTINTLPQSTLDAFREHGRTAPTLEQDVEGAFDCIRRLEEAGINFKTVTDELQVQGVQLFSEAFQTANGTLRRKREAFLAEKESGIRTSARE
ncbi:MAG: transaldolase [Dehalococcoidia bacterium]|nr:transaldolase [Dehalococcoidia bacterium]